MKLPSKNLLAALTIAATVNVTATTSVAQGLVYFDEHATASDTIGNLMGTVKYAQTSIIPAVNHHYGDKQPKLTALRETLVLFKPHVAVNHNAPLLIFGKDKNGRVVFAKKMNSPQNIMQHTNRDLFLDDGKYDYNIGYQSQLDKVSQLRSNGRYYSTTYFNEILESNDVVRISINEKNHIDNLVLPKIGGLTGRKVVIVNSSNTPTTVHLGGSVKPISIDKEVGKIVAVNKNGFWNVADDTFKNVRYGKYWTATVDAKHIENGLKFSFLNGSLSSKAPALSVLGESQLLLNMIDVGLLTEPRNKRDFVESKELQRQFFQMIPHTRLIVSDYQPVHFKEVMMPNGELYTEASPAKANVYSGNMHNSISRHLLGRGIHKANIGQSSSAAFDRTTTPTNSLTGITSIGNYSNGIVRHGASSTGDTFSLISTISNEFSHEIGHSFGLPHFPGGFETSKHKGADSVNSTWGWDKDKNKFITNFSLRHSMRTDCLGESNCNEPFKGRLAYNRDAMAGGQPVHIPGNAFTLYTPFSMSSIQTGLIDKMNFDKYSPTGFTKFNRNAKQQVPVRNIAIRPTSKISGSQVEFSGNGLSKALSKHIEVDLKGDLTERGVEVNPITGVKTIRLKLPKATKQNASKYITVKDSSNYRVIFENPNGKEISMGPMGMKYTKYVYSTGKGWESSYSRPKVEEERKPSFQGARVAMVYGYYDPEGELPTYIYDQPLYGSYGMLYASQHHRFKTDKTSCRLEVTLKSGARSQHSLSNRRLQSPINGEPIMNKFHVNFPQSNPPKKAAVYCNNKLLSETDLKPRDKSVKIKGSIQGISPIEQHNAVQAQKRRGVRN